MTLRFSTVFLLAGVLGMVVACSGDKSEPIPITKGFCLNLFPDEKELNPITPIAVQAFEQSCKSSEGHFLQKVFASKAHNIFLSQAPLGSPGLPADSASGIRLVLTRPHSNNPQAECLYVSGEEWIVRLTIPDSQHQTVFFLDFAGRDSVFMKKLFAVKGFFAERTRCS